MMIRRPKGLGRGLDALLGDSGAAVVEAPPGAPQTLTLEQLRPGRYQPRTKMDPDSLSELADSIRAQGVIQPILVRPAGNDTYEIIAGERRYRAAQIAGLTEVPVLVKRVSDEAALAIALIENIQREDLNALEQAHGVHRLVQEFGFTHEQAAQAIGRSRSATTNLLRLLNLASPVQQLLMDGALEMGHARALLPLKAVEQIQLGQNIAARGLSVREAETLVERALRPTQPREPSHPTADRDLTRLQEELSDALGTTVSVRVAAKGRGQIRIAFASLDQLQGLIQRLRQ
ncbi:MAG: ParB/RepB/Spo0J family partition protein [Betaproteobacteria bacterium]|jgi:ParB family chromosome partitioning protein|nr:MAG: ParB/RepB/Spo0J family partition protein [Betaproteobacteria bacterium]